MPRTLAPDAHELDEVCRILGLSQTELADLFHVRQPSLAQWRVSGIPANRRASVERLVEFARILERELIASRIPEIVRTLDDWLEGRSILQTIRERGVDPVYAYLSRLFAYQG